MDGDDASATSSVTLSPLRLFTTGRYYITNIPASVTWKKNTPALSYSFALRNREPLICFIAGKLTNNFLINQENYSQYTIQVTVDADTNASLTSIFNLCPERGTISSLDRSILKASIKYDKIFDAAERRAHNGAPVPYPYVSDATSLRSPDRLPDLLDLPADVLTNDSLIIVSFTLLNYNVKGRGGISARLEHVYLIELAQETPILETPRKKRIISLVDNFDDE